MKRVKRLMSIMMLITLLTSKVVYASEPDWMSLPGHHNQSILLKNGELESKDTVDSVTRGRYLSTALLEIENEQDGTLHVGVDTITHVYVDRIYQVVFLDVWDDSEEDWKQVGSWTFERLKEEEEDGKLSSNYVGFTVTGCTVNRYYRARAMHLVQIGDDMEGKATETNGVLLTDHEV